jgi:hypothetical protein
LVYGTYNELVTTPITLVITSYNKLVTTPISPWFMVLITNINELVTSYWGEAVGPVLPRHASRSEGELGSREVHRLWSHGFTSGRSQELPTNGGELPTFIVGSWVSSPQ